MSDIIEDGFGNEWCKCNYEDCDLHVVRPGKVQCSNCDVESLRCMRDMLTAERDRLRALLGEGMQYVTHEDDCLYSALGECDCVLTAYLAKLEQEGIK